MHRRPRSVCRPAVAAQVELLEDRTLLSALTVNSLLDNATAGDGKVTLREAVNAANNDTTTDLNQTGNGADTISFASALSNGTITLTGGELRILEDVTVAGPGATRLTVSGGGVTRIFNVFFGQTAVLSGLTLTDGRTTDRGGALYNGGTTTVRNCVLSDNVGPLAGAVFNDGTFTAVGSTFSGNRFDSFGVGAVYNDGTLTAADCVFSDNVARDDAGAVLNTRRGSAAFVRTAFSGNHAGATGGAVDNFGALSVVGCTFSGNTADQDGGALVNHAVATVVNSTFSGNAARGNGGAIVHAVVDGALRLRNVTLTGNRADSDGNGNGRGGDGGGIFSVNEDGGGGGGRRSPASEDGGTADSPPASLENTIVAGNVRGRGTVASELAGTLGVVGFNSLIGAAGSAGGLANGVNGNVVGVAAAAVLDPTLRDNGGPTATHALVAGGRAADAGDNARARDAAGRPLTVDQRGAGYPRVAGARVDIGAFELLGPPRISVADVTASEGTAAGGSLVFRISLDHAVPGPVTVQYATADGSARAGADYVAKAGSVTFAPEETVKLVAVAARPDATVELDETFFLKLSNPAGQRASIARSSGLGAIRNDDAAGVSVSDAVVTEGPAGAARNLNFTITLSKSVDAPVAVTYLTFDGTARAGSDFRNTGGRVTFNPGGSRTRLIQVAVYGEAVVERDESLSLRLSNLAASGRAVALAGSGVGTVLNDDAAGVGVSSVRGAEGNVGDARHLDFVITLSRPVDAPVTVRYATFDGTARAGSDFTAVGGSVTFNPGGSTTRTVRVFLTGDALAEQDETLSLRLSNLSAGGRAVALAGSGVGTILDDDGAADALFANGLADALV